MRFILQVIRHNASTEKTIMLIAHSYGCVVAMEIAALLEEEGFPVKLFLIDGSPKMTVKLIKEQLGEEAGYNFELRVIKFTLSNFMPVQDDSKIIVSSL